MRLARSLLDEATPCPTYLTSTDTHMTVHEQAVSFQPRGEAHMVDIGAKPVTRRVAVAEGRILIQAGTLRLIEAGAHRKGEVLCIARRRDHGR